MNLKHARVLLTGATGGIGSAIADALVTEGASVLMTGRDERSLYTLANEINVPSRVSLFVADLTSASDRTNLCSAAQSWQGGVNVLINNAGASSFALLQDAAGDDVQSMFETNVVAPIELCRSLLPHLQRQPAAHILNIGSVFGAIGYPGYTIYSATKFALRGFSEALRRELGDSRVQVHYLAPRSTKTKINSASVEQLNAQLGTAMDDPERVAQAVVTMLQRESAAQVIGWPEKLFARINAAFPSIVDAALAKQLPTIRSHANARPGRTS